MMIKVKWFVFLYLALICAYAYSGEVIKGSMDGGVYGELIKCAFPNTIVIDGKLDDLPWRNAPWHFISSKDGTVPTSSDKDGSLKFAVVADKSYIYVGADITDDKVQRNEDKTCNVWKDDSIEVYIDAGNEKANAYDVNDAQITVGADFIGVEPDEGVAAGLLGGCVGITQGPATKTVASATETPNGWSVEIGVPMKNGGWDIKIKNGLKIGFNIQYNDDDDGGDRDSKLIWCAKEVKQGEGSWNNPQLFAELQFVEFVLQVKPILKSAITWGGVKSQI